MRLPSSHCHGNIGALLVSARFWTKNSQRLSFERCWASDAEHLSGMTHESAWFILDDIFKMWNLFDDHDVIWSCKMIHYNESSYMYIVHVSNCDLIIKFWCCIRYTWCFRYMWSHNDLDTIIIVIVVFIDPLIRLLKWLMNSTVVASL